MKADIYLFELQIHMLWFVWFKVMYFIIIMIDEAKKYETKTLNLNT